MARQDTELSGAEQRLVEAARSGRECDLGQPEPGAGDDGEASADVVIRAWVLHDLCVNTPHPKGIRVRGGRISGVLDFDWESLEAPLVLDQCVLEGPLSLRDAWVKSIALTDCSVLALMADRMRSTGVVSVARSAIANGISMEGAKLGADLSLDMSRLIGGEATLSARLITVAGDVSLRGISCDGPIRFPAASVRGDFLVSETLISSQDPYIAFDADRSDIGGFFTISETKVLGCLRLSRSRIGADLRILDSDIGHGAAGTGLAADALTASAVLIRNARIRGSIGLVRAHLSSLEIKAGSAAGEGESPALQASGLSVSGSVQIEDSVLGNGIDLSDARITGLLSVSWPGGEPGPVVDLQRSEIGATKPTDMTRAQSHPDRQGPAAPAGAAGPDSAFSYLSRRPGELTRNAVILGSAVVGVSPLVLVSVLAGLQRSTSAWLYGLAGVGIVSVTVLAVLIVRWLQRMTVVASGPAPRFSAYWTRLRPKALQATLASQAAIDRIGQSLASRLIDGNLRNYSGTLSVELALAGEPLAPTAEGRFRVSPAAALAITVTLGPKPVDGAVTETIAINDGTDAPIVDFVLIASLEDLDAASQFTQRSTVSVAPGGPPGGVGLAANAPSEPGDYQLVIEVLQQNRLVSVLRSPIQVMATATDG